jgi:FlaA1/EpsC-like NDP-sugar epimerase
MYSWIWRHLPGPRAVKLVQALVLVAAVLALLILVVFPWVEPRLPFNAVTTG